ncbi:GNAT family N-acetyltransferase [Neptunicoccus cionae]|nr:GNAT family N-acyltransferase [Amylibacter cionae]
MTAFDNRITSVPAVCRGSLQARMATGAGDLEAAQRLRHKMFSGGQAAQSGALDADGFDPKCQHVLVEDTQSGAILACFRFLHLDSGADIGISYSAQFYDLENLHAYPDPMLEIGRFCTAEGVSDPDVIRLGWAMLTRYVDAHSIGMMFGCSSFPGNDTAPYGAALALLHRRHLAPVKWAPRPKAAETRPLVSDDDHGPRDCRTPMPSLLRTYLGMGGWVSDHAVIDRTLGTFHVFTGVEIAKIPQRRAELLRADAR